METGSYNNTNNIESECLMYCFGELIKKDSDCFKTSQNSQRIREQMNSNSLFRPAPQQDILYFTPDFVNYSIRDYKKLILDDDEQYSIMKLLGQFQANFKFQNFKRSKT